MNVKWEDVKEDYKRKDVEIKKGKQALKELQGRFNDLEVKYLELQAVLNSQKMPLEYYRNR